MKRLLYIVFFICSFAQSQMIMDSYKFVAGCTADPNEYNTTANATSDPNCNEADATTGWLSFGSGATMSSQETNVYSGTSAMEQTTSTATTTFMYLNIDVVSGDTYDVTYWLRGNDATSRSTAWTQVTGETTRYASTTWTKYTESITASATATAQLRFYANANASAGSKAIQVDSLSMVKTN